MPTKLIEAIKAVENGEYRYQPLVSGRMVVHDKWDAVEDAPGGLVGYTMGVKLQSRIFVKPEMRDLDEAKRIITKSLSRQVYGEVIDSLLEVRALLYEHDIDAAHEKLRDTIAMMEV